MEDALVRDKLAAENSVLCFDTAAAGAWPTTSPAWPFAAFAITRIRTRIHYGKDMRPLTAAAVCQDLLSRISPNKIEVERKIIDLIYDG